MNAKPELAIALRVTEEPSANSPDLPPPLMFTSPLDSSPAATSTVMVCLGFGALPPIVKNAGEVVIDSAIQSTLAVAGSTSIIFVGIPPTRKSSSVTGSNVKFVSKYEDMYTPSIAPIHVASPVVLSMLYKPTLPLSTNAKMSPAALIAMSRKLPVYNPGSMSTTSVIAPSASAISRSTSL